MDIEKIKSLCSRFSGYQIAVQRHPEKTGYVKCTVADDANGRVLKFEEPWDYSSLAFMTEDVLVPLVINRALEKGVA